jgi:hypothetical protein
MKRTEEAQIKKWNIQTERFTAYEWHECRDGLRRTSKQGSKDEGEVRRKSKQNFFK